MKLKSSKRDALRQRRHMKRLKYSTAVIDQTLKVYAAEDYGHSTTDAKLRNRFEVVRFVQTIMKSVYWKRHHPKRKPFKLKIKGAGRWAYGGPSGITLPDAPRGRRVHTIVHEMAHACSRGHHGRQFIKALLVLVREFEGVHYARRLKRRMYQTGAMRPRKRRAS